MCGGFRWDRQPGWKQRALREPHPPRQSLFLPLAAPSLLQEGEAEDAAVPRGAGLLHACPSSWATPPLPRRLPFLPATLLGWDCQIYLGSPSILIWQPIHIWLSQSRPFLRRPGREPVVTRQEVLTLPGPAVPGEERLTGLFLVAEFLAFGGGGG